MRLVPAPARSVGLVALSYALALAVATALLWARPSAMPPLLALFAADVAATIVVFAFSRRYDNSSFYDAYWSLAPMAIAAWFAAAPPFGPSAPSARQSLVVAVTFAWGARLTYNWLRGWEGLAHEDWRYLEFRRQYPRGYWAFSFAAIHVFPTVCTFASSLPMWAAAKSTAPLGVLDLVGAATALGGTLVEGLADSQLRAYRESCAAEGQRGGICERGLWSWSRHPNYFGECTFWVGLWVLGAAASPADAWWTAIGPITIVALFVFATIPLAEKRSLERRPAFADHQRRVSMLLPLPPKRS
jgi:steroid 5-alpha reductase family enzyme